MRKEQAMSQQSTMPAPVANGAKEAKARRFDPIDIFNQMQADFDQFWSGRWPSLRLAQRLEAEWAPRADVFEQDGKLVIKVELPGVKKDDVDVAIEGGDLVLRGERKAEEKVEEKDFYRMERSYGSFYRRLPLPDGVAAADIKATFKDGVLEVTAPSMKAAAPAAEKIAIN
jgi:HSP20 family protein